MMPELGLVARLIGDPVRAKMLLSLLDGGERAAGDLARRSGATPQSASAHLAKLVAGGLIVVRVEGRNRLFRLATPEIAHALEVLGSISPVAPVSSLRAHTLMQRLRVARTCYDHAAGRLGVAIADALQQRGLVRRVDRSFVVTNAGTDLFASLGIDCDTLRSQKRAFARPCLDWTERRDHIAGGLGAALLATMLERKWVTDNRDDRALIVTPAGITALAQTLDVHLT